MGYQACFIASYPAHLRGRRALPRDTAQLGLPGRCGQPGSSPAPWLAQKRWLQAGSKTICATSNEGRAAKRSITGLFPWDAHARLQQLPGSMSMRG